MSIKIRKVYKCSKPTKGQNKWSYKKTFTDGSNERYYLLEEAIMILPLESLKVLITTLLIANHEGHNIETRNVPNTYLYAKILAKHRAMFQ